MKLRIAVGGATGNVGSEMLRILEQRQFPAAEIVALASAQSAGRKLEFAGRELEVRDLAEHDFSQTDILLLSTGGENSKLYSPRAAAAGCVVIDNSSAFRMDPAVPLVVPEVNLPALRDWNQRRILAVANCSTIQMVVALKPLHDAACIKRVVVATYQAVSGGGRKNLVALNQELESARVDGMRVSWAAGTPDVPFAYNVVPHIDVFVEDGRTKEEWKMAEETRKILDPDIKVSATCVRVPVLAGHSEAVNLEFEKPMDAATARALLERAPGVVVVDERRPGGYAMPLHCAGTDLVYVSRLRDDPTLEHGLNLWIVSDNVRKGAALNAVQIAEHLIGLDSFRSYLDEKGRKTVF